MRPRTSQITRDDIERLIRAYSDAIEEEAQSRYGNIELTIDKVIFTSKLLIRKPGRDRTRRQ